MEVKKLIAKANEAKEKAYAHYSNFKVGAALLTADGKIFTGCNIENASYGLTVCAERTAIFKAVSQGIKDFKAIAVVSDSQHLSPPCGACLQVMREFSADLKVIIANAKGDYNIKKMHELLPYPFTVESLDE